MNIISNRLSKDHPYVLNFDPLVYLIRDRWQVRWRSFDTVKQDCEFDTEDEAVAFADKLKARCHIRHEDEMTEFEEFDRWWRELYPRAQNTAVFTARPTEYKGAMFRSRLEATWAAFFDLASIEWIYEPVDMKGWVPDFLIRLAGRDVFAEVKPASIFGQRYIPKEYDKAIQHHRDVWVMCLGVSAEGYPLPIGSLMGSPTHDPGGWEVVNRAATVRDAETLWRKAQRLTQWKPPK